LQIEPESVKANPNIRFTNGAILTATLQSRTVDHDVMNDAVHIKVL